MFRYSIALFAVSVAFLLDMPEEGLKISRVCKYVMVSECGRATCVLNPIAFRICPSTWSTTVRLLMYSLSER